MWVPEYAHKIMIYQDMAILYSRYHDRLYIILPLYSSRYHDRLYTNHYTAAGTMTDYTQTIIQQQVP